MNLARQVCFNLVNPASCCPAGFSLGGWLFNTAVCVEDMANSATAFSTELTVNRGPCLSNPTTCCPAGFSAVGFDEWGAAICLGY